MEMEVDKLSDFLNNCCRVCLSVENEMIDSSNIVENFNKTIDQLLLECANLKLSNDISGPKQLCEDCTTELVMVAKFLQKCNDSTVALDQLKRQIGKLNKSKQTPIQLDITAVVDVKDADAELYYENFDENVEYVIYDSSTDIIEETDTSVKSQEMQQTDGINSGGEDEQTAYSQTTDEFTSPRPKPTKKMLKSSKKVKKGFETEMGPSIKSIIKHHCRICGAGFAQSNNYTKHLQTHTEYEIETSQSTNEVNESIEIESSIEVSTEGCEEKHAMILAVEPTKRQTKHKKNIQKNHICQYCGRGFPSVSLLATHNRIHTGERPFKCTTCSKSFKTQGALDLHEKRHKGLKSYTCTECGKGFVESSNLKVHMRTHTGEKPHSCTTCGRSFSRVFLLQIHQRTHTGEKPYACETCHKSFAQQGDLAAHRRIHSGERPHRCKICNRGFIKSSGLTQHMRRHFRPSKMNSNSSVENDVSEENVKIQTIDIEPHITADSNQKQITICYTEHPESFHEYLEN